METLVIQPDSSTGQDSCLNQTNPATKRGADDIMRVGTLTLINRPIFKFDLSSITGINAYASSVVISLYCDVSHGYDCNIYPVLRSWWEDEVCWSYYTGTTAWTTAGCGSAGNDYENTIHATTNPAHFHTWFDWTLNTAGLLRVNQWLDGTVTNNGWLMKSTSEGSTSGDLRSSEYTTTSLHPYITIDYEFAGAGQAIFIM